MHLDVIHCRHFVINIEHLVQCNKCVFSTDSNSCRRNFEMHYFRRVRRSDITLHSTLHMPISVANYFASSLCQLRRLVINASAQSL